MHRVISTAAAVLMFAVSANGAAQGAAAHVQGFYRIDRFYGWPGFYHQYPYTLFGYPNYNWSYFPLYGEYSNCDFVWGKPSGKHKKVQRGTWTCS